MISFLLISLLSVDASTLQPYSCGQIEMRKRPYGKVELRVSCDDIKKYNSIFVAEFKKERQHGISLHYDSLWRKVDSCFYINESEEGECLFWDSLGNIVGRHLYHNGIRIGKDE